jgi:hypothetical protein
MKKNLRIFILYYLVILIFSQNLFSQEESHYTCYKTKDPVVADGLLEEADWSAAEWSGYFVDITGNPELKPALATRIKMLWDDNFVYVAAELRETDAWATIQKRDEVIFRDNDFEVFLDPDGNGRNYYEIEVNAFGTIWDLMLTKAYKDGGNAINSWDLEGMKSGIHVNGSLNDPSRTDTSWIVEMALPIMELMKGKDPLNSPAEGVQWRMNFSRVEWNMIISGNSYKKKSDPETGKPLPENNWSWSPMGEIAMHVPEHWGWLEFSSENILPAPLHFTSEKQKTGFRIWLWMDSHEKWNDHQWDSVLMMLQTAGISGILSQANPATLKRMIPLAQKHDIIVQKWFVTLMNNDRDLIKHHPGWFVVSREGKSSITDPAYVKYYRFLCPSNGEVHQFVKSELDKYLVIPGLDGIHLDYIRFPDVILPKALWRKYGIVQDKEYAPYDYCYCSVCREKFKKKSGIDPALAEHAEDIAEWTLFRYDQVTALVAELSDYCHARGKKISAAVFPGPSTAKQIVRQEWNKWPLDEVMPMLYQSFYYASLGWIGKETKEGTVSVSAREPLYSGLYIPSLSPRELESAISKSIEGRASGICLFNFESMTQAHWEALKILSKE